MSEEKKENEGKGMDGGAKYSPLVPDDYDSSDWFDANSIKVSTAAKGSNESN